MTLRGRRRALTRALSEPLHRLTPRGRAVLAAGLTASLSALAIGHRDLLRVGLLLTVLPVLTSLVLGRGRYRLTCSRQVSPRRVAVGEPAQVDLVVTNVSGSRCGLVLAQEQVPYVLGSRPRFVLPGLEPGERRTISYPVRSDVRGRYSIGPLSLSLSDPFDFGEHRRSFNLRDDLVVTPAVMPLAPVALEGDWRGNSGTRPRTLAISGADDATTREYRQGDDLRRVHWRSTAHRGQLMVRREEQPAQSRATLVLDRRRRAHHDDGGRSSLEWAVTALASVAMHLSERGYAVRLAFEDDARDDNARGGARTWASGGGTGAGAHESAFVVLDQLATIDAGGEIELVRAVDDALANSGGLVVAALGQVTAADVAVLARLRGPRTSCVALCAPAPSGQRPAEPRVLDFLRATGWDVVLADPGEPLAATWSRVGSLRPRAMRVQA